LTRRKVALTTTLVVEFELAIAKIELAHSAGVCDLTWMEISILPAESKPECFSGEKARKVPNDSENFKKSFHPEKLSKAHWKRHRLPVAHFSRVFHERGKFSALSRVFRAPVFEFETFFSC
jgi:hypothetical protein